MPGPGQCTICKYPIPGTEKVGKCPSVARGKGEGGLGTAGIDLCISNNDSEGYENVTKKVNSRRFKPYIISLIPSCLLRQILANVFGVEF